MKRKENWDSACKRMVETQIKSRGIRDKRVIEAFLKVPRHLFLPSELWEEAYNDYPLPIGEGQTISQPYMVALMTELLMLEGEERVLEIGTGSGYQTAILAELAQEVYTVERIPSLLKRAEETLKGMGYSNIKFKVGDGTRGWEEFAPYDAIVVTAASPDIPSPFLEQLNLGGRLVLPVGSRYSQDLIRVIKTKRGLRKENMGGCVFVPLIGEYGWKE